MSFVEEKFCSFNQLSTNNGGRKRATTVAEGDSSCFLTTNIEMFSASKINNLSRLSVGLDSASSHRALPPHSRSNFSSSENELIVSYATCQKSVSTRKIDFPTQLKEEIFLRFCLYRF
mmetsp:Transcript_10390/g.15954  ORF Transcript_10390/g.15954 Transcript_10390/m.15954 type:complete len:118 (+) Transcript_10390:1464-1817(+)